LKRERRYWQDEVQDLDDAIRLDLEEALPTAVTVLTLLGGLETKTKAQELTRRLLPEAGTATAKLLATLLHRLYSAQPGSGRHLGGLEPDLLGEELVWQELQQNLEALHAALDLADHEGSKQLLTVLTRLAQRPERAAEAAAWLKEAFETKLDDLAEPALEVAVVQGDPVGLLLAEVIQERASLELAAHIMDRCGESDLWPSVHLREVALHSTQLVYNQLCELLELVEEPIDEEYTEVVQKGLALIVLKLGNTLGDLGRREEALQATWEAVNLYCLLAQKRPEEFRSDLAMSLNNLGARLGEFDWHEESLLAGC
jgi:tetratricopeptide (TPR) repeat protein